MCLKYCSSKSKFFEQIVLFGDIESGFFVGPIHAIFIGQFLPDSCFLRILR